MLILMDPADPLPDFIHTKKNVSIKTAKQNGIYILTDPVDLSLDCIRTKGSKEGDRLIPLFNSKKKGVKNMILWDGDNIIPFADRIDQVVNAVGLSNDDIYIYGDFRQSYLYGLLSDIVTKAECVITTGVDTDERLIKMARKNKNTEDTIVIVSNDADFIPVQKKLVKQCRVIVVFSDHKGTRSEHYEKVNNVEYIEIPSARELDWSASGKSARNKVLASIRKARLKGLYPTYEATVQVVTDKYGVPRNRVAFALAELIDAEYIYQDIEYQGKRQIRCVNVNWDRLEKENVFSVSYHDFHKVK